jgi:hypothetical protein
VGLANGRVSYVTTPEEYDAQHYEGAQNLFGAATGPLIAHEIVTLGKNGVSPPLDPSYAYDPGECRVFLPSDAGLPPHLPDDGLGNILVDAAGPKRDSLHACWLDAIPSLAKIGSGCVRPVPYVWVEELAPNPADQCTAIFETDLLEDPCNAPAFELCGLDRFNCIDEVPQDNCGLDLVTVLHGSYADRTRWCAFWLPPGGATPDGHVLCVAGVTGENVMQIPGSQKVPDRPLDAGDTGVVSTLNRYLECCGHPKVCSFPTVLP